MSKIVIMLSLVLAALTPVIGWSSLADPFEQFHVYSLGDIGTDNGGYTSDIDGVIGAAGDVYFKSFSAAGKGSTDGYTLHTGGSAYLKGGSYTGSLDISKDLTLQSLSVNGDIYMGGSLNTQGGGTINGSIAAGGSADLPKQWSATGGVKEGTDYVGLDYDAISSYFKGTSSSIASMSATGKITNNWGGLSYSAAEGINVLEISSSDLKNAWGFDIKGSAGSKVLINVSDSSATLDSTNWSYSGGITAADVILNFADAEKLSLSSSNNVNILAPLADTYFSSGVITGSLIVGNLNGGGQINFGQFTPGSELSISCVTPPSIPEPAAIAFLAIGSLVTIRRRRKV